MITKAQQLRFAEMLRSVRIEIERSSPNSAFVCNAISRLYGYSKDSIDLRDYIRESLGMYTTVDDWLDANHPQFYQSTYHKIDYRLAWIDQMISMFKQGKG